MEENEEQGIEIPYDMVPPETLNQLIKSFVLREGTDYGLEEVSLDTKIEQIHRQLVRGDLKILFDLASETGTIVSKDHR